MIIGRDAERGRPVVGTGVRLFKDPADPTVLKLVGTRTFDSGVVVLVYQPPTTEGQASTAI